MKKNSIKIFRNYPQTTPNYKIALPYMGAFVHIFAK